MLNCFFPSWDEFVVKLNSEIRRYKVTWRDFVSNRGEPVIAKHRWSPARTLIEVYNDHTFLPWRFRFLSKGVFEHRKDRREYIDWLKKVAGVEKDDDLTIQHFRNNHGYSPLLRSSYPFPLNYEQSNRFLNAHFASPIDLTRVLAHPTFPVLSSHGLLKMYGQSISNILASLNSDDDNSVETLKQWQKPKKPAKYWVYYFSFSRGIYNAFSLSLTNMKYMLDFLNFLLCILSIHTFTWK